MSISTLISDAEYQSDLLRQLGKVEEEIDQVKVALRSATNAIMLTSNGLLINPNSMLVFFLFHHTSYFSRKLTNLLSNVMHNVMQMLCVPFFQCTCYAGSADLREMLCRVGRFKAFLRHF